MRSGSWPPVTATMVPIPVRLVDLSPFVEHLAQIGRRSGMATVEVQLEPIRRFELERFKRAIAGIEATTKATKPAAACSLPSFTAARLAPLLEQPAPATRPSSTTPARRDRTDREAGRRRARSRDYARTGRSSRRPAP